jgi:hypothetical protein
LQASAVEIRPPGNSRELAARRHSGEAQIRAVDDASRGIRHPESHGLPFDALDRASFFVDLCIGLDCSIL